jgi:hypothetical protein
MNTIGTAAGVASQVWRNKYRLSSLDKSLRAALVAEKICMVDRSDSKTIQSPYGSQPSVTQQALTGTYSTAAFTLTDDTLTVTEEFVVAEHVYDFENSLTNFDVFANRVDEQNYAMLTAIDKYVLNAIGTDGTGAYTTPVGGFATAANINVIMSNLLSKVAGYSTSFNDLYLVIEPTEIPGFVQAQATNGFNFADAALNNGFVGNYMGVDIYVVKAGTFATTTLGTKSVTMSGCRLFGVKNTTTYAAPRGLVSEELMVTGKTGREERTFGYCGAKVWATKAVLTVKITLA